MTQMPLRIDDYVNDDSVPQTEPAVDDVPLNGPDAAEEAAVIDNCRSRNAKTVLERRTTSHVQWKKIRSERGVSSEVALDSMVSNPRTTCTKLQEQPKP